MRNGFWVFLGLIGAAGVTTFFFEQDAKSRAESIQKSFEKFSPAVKTRADDKNFFVESNGMPDHPLMVGITAWQQQVPLPQKYFGANAWQFPLFPVEAKEKLSAKDHFFRGAIAIAADGVPIFNPIKNDGHTDTYLAGELDDHGGHSGRGDDYHYHIAPVYLEKQLGKGLPVAFAMDGYPIYGYTDPDGKTPKDLDHFNGHTTAKLGYHYHATKTYPYLNGGFHGEVTEQEGQVHPQPHAHSPRPATTPLKGAKITDFKVVKAGSYSLTYTLNGETRKVNYEVQADGSVKFEFVDGAGKVETQVYKDQGNRGQGQPGPRDRGGEPSGPPLGPPPGPRKPWLADHFKELDANSDGTVTLEEVVSQCKDAFKQYANGKDAITISDLPGLPTVRLAIGGFVKVHAKELDGDSDGKLIESEIVNSMTRMFKKQDRNGDGKLTSDEVELRPGGNS